jgi:hypothetical protein
LRVVPKSDSRRLVGPAGIALPRGAIGVVAVGNSLGNTSSGFNGTGVGSSLAASGVGGNFGASLSSGADDDITLGSDTALLGIAAVLPW